MEYARRLASAPPPSAAAAAMAQRIPRPLPPPPAFTPPPNPPASMAVYVVPPPEEQARAIAEDLCCGYGDIDGEVEVVTKQTYDWDRKAWSSREVEVQIDWAQPIAEGNLRVALRLRDLTRPLVHQCCVAKYQKPRHYLGDEQTYIDVEMQSACRAIAAAFNAHSPPKPVQFLEAWVISRSKDNVPPNMAILAVEPYINPTKYMKHNNNFGYINPLRRNTPQAFSHFSWEYTNHLMMVVDIQGVGDIYTDPQVHTACGQGFGMGNRGPQGIQTFLATHRCNPVCQALGLPFVGTDTAPPRSPATAPTPATATAFRPRQFIGRLSPTANSALPEDLALLGLEKEEFNRIVTLWRRYTSDDEIFTSEAVSLLCDLGFDLPDGDPTTVFGRGLNAFILFTDFLCLYCGLPT